MSLKLISEEMVFKTKTFSGLVSNLSLYFHRDRTHYCHIGAKEMNVILPFTEARGGKVQ